MTHKEVYAQRDDISSGLTTTGPAALVSSQDDLSAAPISKGRRIEVVQVGRLIADESGIQYAEETLLLVVVVIGLVAAVTTVKNGIGALLNTASNAIASS